MSMNPPTPSAEINECTSLTLRMCETYFFMVALEDSSSLDIDIEPILIPMGDVNAGTQTHAITAHQLDWISMAVVVKVSNHEAPGKSLARFYTCRVNDSNISV